MQLNGKKLPAAKPRSGHGAASVIPHLNDVIPLEPSHLCDAWPEAPEPVADTSSGTRDPNAKEPVPGESGDAAPPNATAVLSALG